MTTTKQPSSVSNLHANLDITIPRVNYQSETTGGQVVVYEIRYQYIYGHRIFTDVGFKRYSEFLTLHTKLKKAFPDVPLPNFPGKKRFGNLDRQFVDQRRAQLETYLQALQKHVDPRISLNEDLLAFLPEAYGRYLMKVFGYITFHVTDLGNNAFSKSKRVTARVSPLHRQLHLINSSGTGPSESRSLPFNDIRMVVPSASSLTKCRIHFRKPIASSSSSAQQPSSSSSSSLLGKSGMAPTKSATMRAPARRETVDDSNMAVNPLWSWSVDQTDLNVALFGDDHRRQSKDDMMIGASNKSAAAAGGAGGGGATPSVSMMQMKRRRKADINRFRSHIVVATPGRKAPSLLDAIKQSTASHDKKATTAAAAITAAQKRKQKRKQNASGNLTADWAHEFEQVAAAADAAAAGVPPSSSSTAGATSSSTTAAVASGGGAGGGGDTDLSSDTATVTLDFDTPEDRMRFTCVMACLEEVINGGRGSTIDALTQVGQVMPSIIRMAAPPTTTVKHGDNDDDDDDDGDGDPYADPFLRFLECTVFCSTWNMAKRPPPEDIGEWVPKGGDGHALFVIGLQECTEKQDVMVECVSRQLGSRYTILAKKGLWEIRILIFIDESKIALTDCWNIRTASVATGIMGIMGNKGGVGVSFSIFDTSFCFINTHLAPHQPRYEERNRMFHDILTGLQSSLGSGSVYLDLEHDVIMWLGDLNYRIDLPHSRVLQLVQEQRFDVLYASDQLRRARVQRKAFFGFSEGKLRFAPTYKYVLPKKDKKDKKHTAAVAAAAAATATTTAPETVTSTGKLSSVDTIPEGEESTTPEYSMSAASVSDSTRRRRSSSPTPPMPTELPPPLPTTVRVRERSISDATTAAAGKQRRSLPPPPPPPPPPSSKSSVSSALVLSAPPPDILEEDSDASGEDEEVVDQQVHDASIECGVYDPLWIAIWEHDLLADLANDPRLDTRRHSVEMPRTFQRSPLHHPLLFAPSSDWADALNLGIVPPTRPRRLAQSTIEVQQQQQQQRRHQEQLHREDEERGRRPRRRRQSTSLLECRAALRCYVAMKAGMRSLIDMVAEGDGENDDSRSSSQARPRRSALGSLGDDDDSDHHHRRHHHQDGEHKSSRHHRQHHNRQHQHQHQQQHQQLNNSYATSNDSSDLSLMLLPLTPSRGIMSPSHQSGMWRSVRQSISLAVTPSHLGSGGNQSTIQSTNLRDRLTKQLSFKAAAAAAKGGAASAVALPAGRAYKKNRIPSWCDRILYRQYNRHLVKQQSYTPSNGMMTSDHLPVVSVFRFRIPRPLPATVFTNPCDIAFLSITAAVPQLSSAAANNSGNAPTPSHARSRSDTGAFVVNNDPDALYIAFSGPLLSENSRKKRTVPFSVKPGRDVAHWTDQDCPVLHAVIGQRSVVANNGRIYFSLKHGNTLTGVDAEIGQGVIRLDKAATQDSWQFETAIMSNSTPMGVLSGTVQMLFER